MRGEKMIKVKVGNRIKKLRKQKKLSQEKLAHRSELDRTYISSVEAGKRNISIVSLEKIVKQGLETDLSTFFNKIYEEWSNEKTRIIEKI